jgi:hypothetical protein
MVTDEYKPLWWRPWLEPKYLITGYVKSEGEPIPATEPAEGPDVFEPPSPPLAANEAADV